MSPNRVRCIAVLSVLSLGAFSGTASAVDYRVNAKLREMYNKPGIQVTVLDHHWDAANTRTVSVEKPISYTDALRELNTNKNAHVRFIGPGGKLAGRIMTDSGMTTVEMWKVKAARKYSTEIKDETIYAGDNVMKRFRVYKNFGGSLLLVPRASYDVVNGERKPLVTAAELQKD